MLLTAECCSIGTQSLTVLAARNMTQASEVPCHSTIGYFLRLIPALLQHPRTISYTIISCIKNIKSHSLQNFQSPYTLKLPYMHKFWTSKNVCLININLSITLILFIQLH